MNSLSRIDSTSWSIEFPKKLKRHNYSKGIGLCNGKTVGNASSTYKLRGVWWPNSEAELLTLEGMKELSAQKCRGKQVVGRWTSSNREKVGAVLWNLNDSNILVGINLHSDEFTSSYAFGVSNGVQVGQVYPKVNKGEYSNGQAVIWNGDAKFIKLTSLDWKETGAFGTDGEYQVGYVEGNRERKAALWNGSSESLVIIGSSGFFSEAYAIRDGEQVGMFSKGVKNRAALWKNTSDSMIDLTPKGFEVSVAFDCAKGFQVGYVKKHDLTPSGASNMETNAVIWSGSTDFLDLQSLLPAEWTASLANFVEVNGDEITIVGTAEKITTTQPRVDASQVLSESSVVVWKTKICG